jgi:hypothetical protein
MRAVAALVVVVAVASACAAEQDPGLTVQPGNATATTSQLLPECPAGGPDTTTPSAGCVGPDGAVQRP